MLPADSPTLLVDATKVIAALFPAPELPRDARWALPARPPRRDGETRVDWRVKAVREGEATIRMSALTDAESDAMQQSFPVLVHGMLKTESFSGVIRPTETTGKFTVTVPEKRRAEQTRLEVRYSPTLAGAMVDALP